MVRPAETPRRRDRRRPDRRRGDREALLPREGPRPAAAGEQDHEADPHQRRHRSSAASSESSGASDVAPQAVGRRRHPPARGSAREGARARLFEPARLTLEDIDPRRLGGLGGSRPGRVPRLPGRARGRAAAPAGPSYYTLNLSRTHHDPVFPPTPPPAGDRDRGYHGSCGAGSRGTSPRR